MRSNADPANKYNSANRQPSVENTNAMQSIT